MIILLDNDKESALELGARNIKYTSGYYDNEVLRLPVVFFGCENDYYEAFKVADEIQQKHKQEFFLYVENPSFLFKQRAQDDYQIIGKMQDANAQSSHKLYNVDADKSVEILDLNWSKKP